MPLYLSKMFSSKLYLVLSLVLVCLVIAKFKTVVSILEIINVSQQSNKNNRTLKKKLIPLFLQYEKWKGWIESGLPNCQLKKQFAFLLCNIILYHRIQPVLDSIKVVTWFLPGKIKSWLLENARSLDADV